METQVENEEEPGSENRETGSRMERDFEAPPLDRDAEEAEIDLEDEEEALDGEERRIAGLTIKQLLFVSLGTIALIAILLFGLFKMAGARHRAAVHSVPYSTMQNQNEVRPTPVHNREAGGAQRLREAAPIRIGPASSSLPAQQAAMTTQAQNAKLATMVKENGSAVLALHKTVETNTDTLKALNARISSLETRLSSVSNGSVNGASSADMTKLHKQINALQGELASERAHSRTLSAKVKELSARPVLPGWHVAAVTDRGAVLTGPGQIVQVVKPGDSFYGLRILKLLPGKGEILTSAGVLREN